MTVGKHKAILTRRYSLTGDLKLRAIRTNWQSIIPAGQAGELSGEKGRGRRGVPETARQLSNFWFSRIQ